MLEVSLLIAWWTWSVCALVLLVLITAGFVILGGKKCGHGLTSRPRESASEAVLNELLQLFRYPPWSAPALLAGILPLRCCAVRFASKVPAWRLPVPGHAAGLVTADDGVADVVEVEAGGEEVASVRGTEYHLQTSRFFLGGELNPGHVCGRVCVVWAISGQGLDDSWCSAGPHLQVGIHAMWSVHTHTLYSVPKNNHNNHNNHNRHHHHNHNHNHRLSQLLLEDGHPPRVDVGLPVPTLDDVAASLGTRLRKWQRSLRWCGTILCCAATMPLLLMG